MSPYLSPALTGPKLLHPTAARRYPVSGGVARTAPNVGHSHYSEDVAAVFWLVAGLVLAAAEMFVGELTLLMLGGSALITAGVAFAADTGLVVDAVIFAVSAMVLLLGVRPVLLRRFGTPPPTPTNVDALTGRTAQVLEPVDEHGGLVKLSGEVWTARSFDPGEQYPEGTTVYVMKIDGATAVVWKGP